MTTTPITASASNRETTRPVSQTPTYRGRYLSDAVLEDLCNADATRENDASWERHGDGLGIPRAHVIIVLS